MGVLWLAGGVRGGSAAAVAERGEAVQGTAVPGVAIALHGGMHVHGVEHIHGQRGAVCTQPALCDARLPGACIVAQDTGVKNEQKFGDDRRDAREWLRYSSAAMTVSG